MHMEKLVALIEQDLHNKHDTAKVMLEDALIYHEQLGCVHLTDEPAEAVVVTLLGPAPKAHAVSKAALQAVTNLAVLFFDTLIYTRSCKA